ncbi:DoxX family protein [Lysobacter humi (ex Lee et al. 2017)]
MRDTAASPLARLEHRLARHPDIGLLLLRIVIGGHPVVMTWDNVTSWARMLEFRDFLAHHGFAFPLACALLSVAGQFLGGLALVLGLWTRPAALVVWFNFIVAIAMVDAKAPYPAAFPALALVAGGLCLASTGAGRLSLDARLRERL